MASFQIVPTYTLPPGVCWLCKSAQRFAGEVPEQIIDCGLDVDWEGRIYCCASCVREMAILLDMSTERYGPLRDRFTAMEAELDRTLAMAKEFEGRFNDLIDAMAERAEARVPPSVPEAAERVLSEEAHPVNRGGRPRLPRDEHGRIIR